MCVVLDMAWHEGYFVFLAVLEMQFDRSSYRVNESAGSVQICVEKVGSAEIAPGVTVNIVVVEISDKHLGTIGFILNV